MNLPFTTPLDPQYVWSDLVAQAESLCASDTSISVPRINFMYETWPKLQELLAIKAKNPNEKNVRFPLVALIRKSASEWKADDEGHRMRHTIIIVTKSEATKKLEDRISENYVPTLRPIRDVLLNLAAKSPYFHGYVKQFPECRIDENYQFNAESQGYKLGDALDGIVIDDLLLTYNPPMVTLYRPAPSKTLVYVNDIQQLRVAGQGTSNLTVTLFAALYTDTLNLGAGTNAKYYVNYGHVPDSPIQISVGSGNAIVLPLSNEVNGTYYGYISCSDGLTVAKLGFVYIVEAGIIKHHTTDNRILLQDIQTQTSTYPTYDIGVYAVSAHTRAAISSVLITTDGGNTLQDYLYNPDAATTGTLSETFSLEVSSGYREIATVITLEGTTIDSYSYYKLQ